MLNQLCIKCWRNSFLGDWTGGEIMMTWHTSSLLTALPTSMLQNTSVWFSYLQLTFSHAHLIQHSTIHRVNIQKEVTPQETDNKQIIFLPERHARQGMRNNHVYVSQFLQEFTFSPNKKNLWKFWNWNPKCWINCGSNAGGMGQFSRWLDREIKVLDRRK